MRAALLTACTIALLQLSVPEQGEAFSPGAAPLARDPARATTVADAEHQRVERAQLRLRSLGLYHGTTNGTLGPQTRDALSEYQRKLKLPVTGRLDQRTAYALDNNDLIEICVARGVAATDCLGAIKQFYATFPEPGGKSSSATGDVNVGRACEGAKDVSDCASAVAAMSTWLGARSGLQK